MHPAWVHSKRLKWTRRADTRRHATCQHQHWSHPTTFWSMCAGSHFNRCSSTLESATKHNISFSILANRNYGSMKRMTIAVEDWRTFAGICTAREKHLTFQMGLIAFLWAICRHRNTPGGMVFLPFLFSFFSFFFFFFSSFSSSFFWCDIGNCCSSIFLFSSNIKRSRLKLSKSTTTTKKKWKKENEPI